MPIKCKITQLDVFYITNYTFYNFDCTTIQHFFTVHEGIRRNLCSTCGKSFHKKSYLAQHIASIHEGTAKYPCEQCGKVFKAKEAVRRHQKYAHEGLNFECKMCGKSYSQPNNLKLHLRKAHEGLGLKVNKGRGGGISFTDPELAKKSY